MDTPFTDYIPKTDRALPAKWHNEDLSAGSPFQPLASEDNFMQDFYPASASLVQQKIGDLSFTIANADLDNSAEFKEPVPSGNALLLIPDKDRQKKISTNFTVGELTQAQSGKYKWQYARIDPDLVSALQRLRNFLGLSIEVLDAYYTPAYLRDVLQVTDPLRISRNANISGREVKIYVKGFENAMKQIAMAALEACGTNIHVSIGKSSITLAVKKSLIAGVPADSQRITSYLPDERYKVLNYNFCIDFKNLLYDKFTVYETFIHKATAALAVSFFKLVYANNIEASYSDWQTPLKSAISVLYDLSKTKNPNVILYCLAYSPFGFLFRHYQKDNSQFSVQTVGAVIDELTSELDKTESSQSLRNSFLNLLYNNTDKTEFIRNVHFRISRGKDNEGIPYFLVRRSFFDWMHNEKDKDFLTLISALIKDVYILNGYVYEEQDSSLPQGGGETKIVLARSNPDMPVTDLTGRYQSSYTGSNGTSYAANLVINQSGNFISGKLSEIFKIDLANLGASSAYFLGKPVKTLDDCILPFYGTMDKDGIVVGDAFPQRKIVIRKNSVGGIICSVLENSSGTSTAIYGEAFQLVSDKPVISARAVNAFSFSGISRDLSLILAWMRPLAAELQAFFESFKQKDEVITKAITAFYNESETVPSQRRRLLNSYISKVDLVLRDNILPIMQQPFTDYYTRFFLSASQKWRPASGQPYRSKLDWVKQMLTDYRDAYPPIHPDASFYKYLEVDTVVPAVLYKYKINLKLNSFGVAFVSRSSGTITVENQTDYTKYPNAEKWPNDNKIKEFPIVLWSAQLSLNPLSLIPKIGVGAGMEAETNSNVFYKEFDFSGASIQVTEGNAFELPFSKSNSGVTGTAKTSISGKVILIHGKGKGKLELMKSDFFELPEGFEIKPDIPSSSEPWMLKFLPSLTMYKGEINSISTSLNLSTIALPHSFSASYQETITAYFKHNDALLTKAGIDAIGKLCAEELSSFSDSASELEIYGHTDASGTDSYNFALSAARAANVYMAIEDKLGKKLKATKKKISGFGESEANRLFGDHNNRNAWLRKVIILINGRPVLTLGE